MRQPSPEAFQCPHDHCFLSENQKANERRTWIVIALTVVTMIAEIVNDSNLAGKVRKAIEKNEDAVIEDLHIWKIGPGHHSAIVSLRTGTAKEPSYFKNQLCSIPALSHVTVEVNSQQIKS